MNVILEPWTSLSSDAFSLGGVLTPSVSHLGPPLPPVEALKDQATDNKGTGIPQPLGMA